ncbi:MAG: hypothetical protein CMM70_04755 [Rhodospirillaceae bacterium]|nr:hypothetical protein [Rhodospirillaceae bacterium]
MPKNKGKISAACLTKHFGTAVAVDGIDFTIEAGSYCCLLGPSGCGKTTTLRMISGHDNQTSGTISIDEADMGVIPPAQRPTAMMFQNYALFPHMSVEDKVAFFPACQGRRPHCSATAGGAFAGNLWHDNHRDHANALRLRNRDHGREFYRHPAQPRRHCHPQTPRDT